MIIVQYNYIMKIGICGKMCSGKSTLANKIIERCSEMCDEKYEKDSFAGKIYELAYDLFGMKEKDRLLLQQIGTKMRDIDKKVWIDYIIKKHEDTENIIIDDVRYSNEIMALIENGYFLIKLEISPKLQEKRIKDLYKNSSDKHLINRNHPSEVMIDYIGDDRFDLIINVDKDKINTIVNNIVDDVISTQSSSPFSPVLL